MDQSHGLRRDANKWHGRARLSLVCITVASALSACAPPAVQMRPSELSLVRHTQPLYSVHVRHRILLVMTPGKALFSGFGAYAGVQEGKRWMTKYQVPNPAALVEHELANTLQQRDLIGKVSPAPQGLPDDKIAHLQKAFGHHGLVLDATMLQWNVMYYPLAFGRYRMMYAERVRLVDLAQGKTVWQHVCKVRTNNSATAPSFDEMQANNGAVLKQFTRKLAQRCTQELANAFSASSS
ncbi:MAG: hypothetical protein ACYCOU_19165 [Sulfobacillus sp.]